MKYLFWVIAPCLLIFGAFALKQNTSDAPVRIPEIEVSPTKRQLRRSFFEKREVLLVYSASTDELADRYEQLFKEVLENPEEGFMGNIAVTYKAADKITEQDITDRILFLVGTVNNPLIKRLTRDIPLKFEPKNIAYGTRKITSESAHLLVSFVPNPENRLLPIGMMIGLDEEELYSFFASKIKKEGLRILRQNLDFNIYKNSTRLVLGNFDEDWKLDPTTLFDFTDKNTLVHTSEYFDFISYADSLPSKMLQTLADRTDKTITRILKFLESPAVIPKMKYHIYDSAEEKGLITGYTSQAHYALDQNAVHTVINNKYEDNYIEKENALLITNLLGASNNQVLSRGLPIYFTRLWQRAGYDYWTARLYKSGNALPLAELMDGAILDIESPLITDAMSASLVAFLLEIWGKEKFLKAYHFWSPSEEEIKQLAPLWEKYLAGVSSKFPVKKIAERQLGYLKGFNFAHEGYSIYNGYASAKATAAISKQKEMGSNALAIIPYSYIEDVNEPAPFYFSHSAGNENDEGVVHSAFEAKTLGMFTLLKPQIFVGNSWPGDIEMPSEAKWELFFDYYYRWIRHYAFLAEIHNIDALCIGVEFTKATLKQGDRWREMIKRTRGLYGGKITYAANWGAEFENIEFWDELDFIGLNCYYPLSKKDQPTDEELKAKFDTIKTKVNKVYSRFKKPIVFTEIGFRSINMPWKNPHAEGDDSFNEEHQKRCYEIVFNGIDNAPWCKGILWWKFPSYLEYRGKENSAFTPNNKKAEAVVSKWFLK